MHEDYICRVFHCATKVTELPDLKKGGSRGCHARQRTTDFADTRGAFSTGRWRNSGQEASTERSRSPTVKREASSWCFQSSHGNRRTTQRRRARRWLAARCSFALTSVKAVGQSLRVLLLDVPLSSSAEELEGQTTETAKRRQTWNVSVM